MEYNGYISSTKKLVFSSYQINKNGIILIYKQILNFTPININFERKLSNKLTA